jgi:hypothetical protein
MPARSQAQRALLNARFGHQWVKAHHFDNQGKLPKYAHGQGGVTQPRPRKIRYH